MSKPSLSRLRTIIKANIGSFTGPAIVTPILYLVVYIVVRVLPDSSPFVNFLEKFQFTSSIAVWSVVTAAALPPLVFFIVRASTTVSGTSLSTTEAEAQKTWLFGVVGVLWASLGALVVCSILRVDYLTMMSVCVSILSWLAFLSVVSTNVLL